MAKASRRSSLARGRSWPITTSDLRAGLGDTFDEVGLVWYETDEDDDLVWVSWKPDADRHPESFAADDNSMTIWVAPVDVEVAQQTHDLICSEVLPSVREWIRDAISREIEWQSRSHSKRWRVADGSVSSRTHDESDRHRAVKRNSTG
jgi:hypothetical protein